MGIFDFLSLPFNTTIMSLIGTFSAAVLSFFIPLQVNLTQSLMGQYNSIIVTKLLTETKEYFCLLLSLVLNLLLVALVLIIDNDHPFFGCINLLFLLILFIFISSIFLVVRIHNFYLDIITNPERIIDELYKEVKNTL